MKPKIRSNLRPAGRPAGLTPRLLEVIRTALLEHFREEPPAPLAKRIVLPRRGKSGK